MKKFIVLIICVISVISLFGCKNDTKETQTIEVIGGEQTDFAYTNNSFVEGGKSEYKIVIPADASKIVKYAAEELQNFVEESTNATLPIVSDSSVTYDNNGKYLSVGETTLLESQTDITVDYEVLGENGVIVSTKGNCVYITGATDNGTLFSVYRFLHYQVGYNAYAYDCTEVEYFDSVNLKAFDYEYVPSIGLTTAEDAELSGEENVKAAMRMYVYASENGGYDMNGSLYNGLWCHTTYYLVSQSTYPDLWRNNQLCYSNPLSAEIAAQTLIDKYIDTATGPYLMLGVTDGVGSCDCDNCLRDEELYGGASGVQMRFMNDVANRVETYMDENGIDKNIVLVAFAYYSYRQPPVKEVNGEYVAVDESVIPKKTGKVRVGVMYTPIEACYTHAISDEVETCEKNATIAEEMKQWASITDYLMMYSYGTNFSAYKYHFNNWSHEGESIRFYTKLGLKYYFEQSCRQNGVSPMSSMRAYVRSRLAWNSAYDIEDLINEFIEHYYGDGAEGVKQYFNSVMENFERIYVINNEEDQNIYYSKISNDECWTRPLLLSLESYLEKADYMIDLGSSSKKDVYKERVFREYFLLKDAEYMKYSQYLSEDEQAELEELVEYGREKYNAYYSRENVGG